MATVKTHSSSILARYSSKALATFYARGVSALASHAAYRLCYCRYEKRLGLLAAGPASLSTTIDLWGRPFELPQEASGLAGELRLFGIHEPAATSVYQSHLRENDHVIEVGANVGYWLAAAARVIGKGGRFMAFEPVRENYVILERNLRRLGPLNCHLESCAVGAQNGTARFFESKVSNYGGLVRHDRQELKGESTVDVRRLDDMLRGMSGFRPAAIRMDIEGAELQVLTGAEATLTHFRPTLFIEFHPFLTGLAPVVEALETLAALGYQRGVLIDRRWDQPWIPHWLRAGRCWPGSLSEISRRLCAQGADLPVFSLIVSRAGC